MQSDAIKASTRNPSDACEREFLPRRGGGSETEEGLSLRAPLIPGEKTGVYADPKPAYDSKITQKKGIFVFVVVVFVVDGRCSLTLRLALPHKAECSNKGKDKYELNEGNRHLTKKKKLRAQTCMQILYTFHSTRA